MAKRFFGVRKTINNENHQNECKVDTKFARKKLLKIDFTLGFLVQWFLVIYLLSKEVTNLAY